ncbi:minor tail protein [Salinibacter phage M8CR30-4]|uniref:Minor tail protein n=2 Tax=Holosalinivirus M8CR302 TaxID=2041855 RepID=A0A2I6UGC3_9CAUD|nr:tail length tape measure protein [Salinibacter phage M8CR30-2]AUO79032.1 minor tail protein [Salinibacter phage M8CR30-2]AUO79073.1 minor tail protein [Salinibacter phage M8CR30-4]
MPSKTFAVNFETSGFAKASSQMSSVADDASDAGDELDDTADSAEDAGDEMDETGSSASAMGSKINTAGKVGAAGLAAITTAVSSAVAGIGTLVAETAQYAKQVDRAAQQSGVARERIQEIAFAAQQVSGADFDAVRDGLKELAIRSQEAAMGTGEAKEAFDRLGISQDFLRNNSTSQIFARLRQELQGASSKMRIMASEMILGGEAGQKMVEVLGLSNEEMSELSAQAQRTGKVLSSDQVAALERTRGAWRSLTSEVVGLGRELGAMFAPLVTQEIIPGLRSMAQSVRGALSALSDLSDTTKGTVAAIAAGTTAVSAALAAYGAWPAIIAGVSAAFSALGTAATTAYAAITSPVTAVVAAIAAIAGIAGLIYDNWSGLSSFFAELFDSLGAGASAIGSALFETFALAWNQIERLFAQAINALISTVNDGLEALGAESYTIDGEVGIPQEEIEANRQRLAQAQQDLGAATSGVASTLEGSFSSGWAAVKQSTSDAVAFVQGKLQDLGGAFSLPSPSAGGGGSSSGGGQGPSSGGEGESGSSLPSLQPIFQLVNNTSAAENSISRLKQAGKAATTSLANGFNRVTSSIGRSVSNLIQGKNAALDFGQTMVSVLGDVISKLVQVAAKLAVVAAIKAAANISSGGITSIGGALGKAFGLADGGVVTGPTLAVVGEGSESEAVLPLSKLEGMLSQPSPMPQATASAPTGAGAQGLAVEVEVRGETRREGRDIVTTYDVSKRAQARRGR